MAPEGNEKGSGDNAREHGILCVSCTWEENCQCSADLEQMLQQLMDHNYITDLKISFRCAEYVKR